MAGRKRQNDMGARPLPIQSGSSKEDTGAGSDGPLRGGHPDQLEALFRDYGARIYGLALRCGLSASEAEDGVQEVFLKVQRRISTFRGEAALSTWLYQVALNTLRDHRRKVVRQTRARSMGSVVEQPADPAFEGHGNTPDENASLDERRRLVREALDRLPTKFREVLVLRELEGLAYRDIARVTGLAQGTVESRIFRARERLAAELRRMEGSL
jgi:RNA polymerase sigma-70 factor (ECF subfamily)